MGLFVFLFCVCVCVCLNKIKGKIYGLYQTWENMENCRTNSCAAYNCFSGVKGNLKGNTA